MKRDLIVACLALIFSLFVLYVVIAMGEEVFATAPNFAPFEEKTWTLSITDDGQLEINGKSIERMSDPELKAILLEIRDALVKQNEDNRMVKHYDRQTGYLLEELEKCQKQLKGGVK